MRADAAGPRTWLAATLAGWSALALVLALAGMGGRVVPLADDPSLVPALPQLAPPLPERLGPPAQYAAISEQPLFSPDRQPHPFFLEGQAGMQDASSEFDYVLSSVLVTPQVKLAILQPPGKPEAAVRVKLGEAVASSPGWRLSDLSVRQAVFVGPGGQRTLELRVFDGQGGLAPTVLAGAPGPGGVRSAPPAAAPAQRPAPAPAPSPPQPPAQGQPGSAAGQAAAPAEVSQEEQMRRIRERIEARRKQLQEQQNTNSP